MPPPSSGAPSLVVCTRFGLRVRDRGWLAHRLALISAITAPSLLSQRDQCFHWVILIDDGLPLDIRKELEQIVRPFGTRAFVYCRKHHNSNTLVELAEDQGLLENGQYLLSGRIDDDDAWSTTMVGAVRAQVGSWLEQHHRAPGLSLTFEDGLEWIMYEMLDVERLLYRGERLVHTPAIREYRQPFIGMSVFVCSPLSDRMTAMAGAHSRVAKHLSATKGFATVVIPSDSPMWLCCRHKQTGSGIRKALGAEVNHGLEDLVARFGMDERGVQSYLAHASDYQYALVKTPISRKRRLIRAFLQVSQQIKDPTTPLTQLSSLHREKDRLVAEMAQLEQNVLGDPEALTAE